MCKALTGVQGRVEFYLYKERGHNKADKCCDILPHMVGHHLHTALGVNLHVCLENIDISLIK